MNHLAPVIGNGRRAALAAMGLLFPILLMAQNYVFGPNVRVNDDSPGSSFHAPYSPGQHLIACRGDTVYLVWRDDRGGESHIWFARSNNAGQNFLPNVRVDNTPFGCVGIMPALAVDDSSGIHTSWLNYNPGSCAFTYYAQSTNGGQDFLPPVRACDSLHEDQYAHCSIAVSRSGRNAYVVRSEAWNDSYPASPYQIMLGRSTDGGATFMTPDTRVNSDTTVSIYNPSVAVFEDTIVFVAWTGGESVYVTRSTDGGATFGPNVARQNMTTSDMSIGVDTMGRVFLVGGGVNFCASTDTGKTFSDWIRIPSANGTYPSLWVSRDGRLYVTWQFWNGTDGMGDEVRLSFSTDGGVSFSQPVDPSDGPLHNDENAATVSANSDGRVFMAWEDFRNGVSGFRGDIYFATGVLAAIEERPLPLLYDLNLSVQPSIAGGFVSLLCDMPRSGLTGVSVHDLSGRMLKSLYEGLRPAGSFQLTWDGRDRVGHRAVAGVYFVSLRTPYGSLTRKVLLVKE